MWVPLISQFCHWTSNAMVFNKAMCTPTITIVTTTLAGVLNKASCDVFTGIPTALFTSEKKKKNPSSQQGSNSWPACYQQCTPKTGHKRVGQSGKSPTKSEIHSWNDPVFQVNSQKSRISGRPVLISNFVNTQ